PVGSPNRGLLARMVVAHQNRRRLESRGPEGGRGVRLVVADPSRGQMRGQPLLVFGGHVQADVGAGVGSGCRQSAGAPLPRPATRREAGSADPRDPLALADGSDFAVDNHGCGGVLTQPGQGNDDGWGGVGHVKTGPPVWDDDSWNLKSAPKQT